MFGLGKKQSVRVVNVDQQLSVESSSRNSDYLHSALFAAANDGMAIHEVVRDDHRRVINYRILDVNPAYELQTGIVGAAVRGKLATEAYGVKEPPYLNDYAAVVDTGKICQFVTTFEPLHKTFSISVVSLGQDQFATVFNDITADQAIQQELKESEQRLRVVFDHSPDGLYVRRLDGTIVEANEAVLSMLGYTRDEVMGQSLRDLRVESSTDIDRVSSILNTLKQHELSEPIEVELTKKDGTGFVAEVRVSSMMMGNEKMLFGMLRNLSLERERQAEMVRFRQAIEHSDDIVMMADLKGTLTYVNPKFTSFYGYTSEEVVGKQTPTILKAGGMSFTELMDYAKVLHLGKTLRQEFDNVTKSGKVVSVTSTSSAIINDQNQPVGALIIQQDTSVQRQIQGKVAQLSRAVDQSPASVVITDTSGNIEYVNAKFTQVTGYTADEALGKNPRILKAGDISLDLYTQMWATITSGGEWQGELHNKKKSGELFWEHASISAIKDNDGVITNYLAVKEDITEAKNTELEKIKSSERIRKQDEALITISKLNNQQDLDFKQLIQQMVSISAETLGVSRVSNWKLSHDGLSLELVDLYDRLKKVHNDGDRLELKQVPAYMEALKSDRVIRAIDVLTDPRTIEFLPYFKEHGITSLLDAPVRVGGKLTGILCVETGERREWTDDESRFVSEIADQLAQAVVNDEKKMAILKFEQRSLELERTNRVMVGRELRMVELKKEIERLKGGTA